MDRVLPVAAELANRHPERTVFTRFIPPARPDQMPGMWQRYYTRWSVATRERLDLQLLELMPPLATLCPPATIIDKTRYSAFAETGLIGGCVRPSRFAKLSATVSWNNAAPVVFKQ